jgi:alkyl hydroperoxide reductase subunit AhpF
VAAFEQMTPSRRYSAFRLLRAAFLNSAWPRSWRSAEPRSSYDVVIIGGGGHGLATAYYLAANHGIKNVAVLERAYIGSGNVGRNTTIVRSNYVLNGNTQWTWEWLTDAALPYGYDVDVPD